MSTKTILYEHVWCTTQLAKLNFNHSHGRTHSWRFSTFYKIPGTALRMGQTSKKLLFLSQPRVLFFSPSAAEMLESNFSFRERVQNKLLKIKFFILQPCVKHIVEHARTIFCVKLSINNHIVSLIHKSHIMRTCLMHHAAYKVEYSTIQTVVLTPDVFQLLNI